LQKDLTTVNDTLKIAVIGMGKMGLLHASLVNSIPGASLVAIYDKSALMKRFMCKAIDNVLITDKYEKFASTQYDAVYVTTPIPSHYSVVENLYKTGITKNVFVEKTLTSDFRHSQHLCQLAQEKGGTNMVGYMCRFAPTYQKAQALLSQSEIGEVTSFKAYAYASDFAKSKGNALPVKGGATRDLGAHIIDLSLWLFGELELTSVEHDEDFKNGIDNGSCFKVKNRRAIEGDFDISWAKEGYRLPEFGLIITGTKGIISVNSDLIKIENDSGESKELHRQDLNDNVPFLLAASEYYREDEHFINSIIGNSKANPDFSEAAKVDYLIEEIEKGKGQF
jgi:predicted dehydrogenase